MAPKDPPVVDPDRVPETLCLGKFNVLVHGDLAMITFTHARPKVERLMNDNLSLVEHVVRARIVTTRDSLQSLRRVLNDLLSEPIQPDSRAFTGKPN